MDPTSSKQEQVYSSLRASSPEIELELAKRGHHEPDASPNWHSKRRRVEERNSDVSTSMNPFAQGTHSRIRGRRGRLKLMTEMPFEILHEIFSQLEPIDLLHLSWSTRTLHNLLMGKNSRFLWNNMFSRLNASDNPPPACPVDLNMAQYTHFLFGKRCMECESNLGRNRSWTMRLRVCRHCLSSARFLPASGPDHEPASWWGLTTIFARNEKYYFKAEYDEVRANAQILLGESLSVYQDTRRQRLEAKREGEAVYEAWVGRRKADRKLELRSLKAERRATILSRLKSLGWDDFEVCQGAIVGLADCLKPKPLTEREWNALWPTLMARLEEVQVVIRKHRHKTRILKRLKTLQERIDEAFATVADGERSLEVDERPLAEDISIIEPFGSTLFQDTQEDPECLNMDRTQLLQLLEEWHRRRRDFILSLLPGYLIESIDGNQTSDPFSLEAVWFCGGEDRNVHYYYHTLCRFRQDSGEIPSDAPGGFHLLAEGEYRRPWQWDQGRWSFDIDRHMATVTMLTFLGLDPGSVTPMEFLSGCDPIRLYCRQCGTADISLYNCWSAMKHELDCHREGAPLPGTLKWQIV